VKQTILFVAALAVAGIAVECRGSIVREEYVAGQNAFHHSDIRFSSEGAWNETFVIYDDHDRDEFDADTCATDPYFTRAFHRRGFEWVRAGSIVRRIR
jgi:hypothetical protein